MRAGVLARRAVVLKDAAASLDPVSLVSPRRWCRLHASLGSLPRVQLPPDGQGYKMLRPAQTIGVCQRRRRRSGARDLLGAAIRRLLARDPEADSVINARVESTRWSLGVYERRCVTVTGDVVRSTSTILLPMPGGHQGHGAHEGPGGH